MRNPLTPSPERIRALEKELFSARIDIDVKGLVRYARAFGFIARILIVFSLVVIDVFFFPVANLTGSIVIHRLRRFGNRFRGKISQRFTGFVSRFGWDP